MKCIPLRLALCVISMMLSHYITLAQKSDSTAQKIMVRIQQRDGTSFIGKVEKVGKDTVIIIDSANEKRFVLFKEIRKIDYLTGRKLRQLAWFPGSNSTGYLFAPTAFQSEPGEVTYKNTYLLLSTFNIGITKRISIGFSGALPGANPLSVNVKGNVLTRNNFNLAGGISYIHLKGDIITNSHGPNYNNLGFFYGAGTWGNRNSNVTFGAGYLLIGKVNLPISFLAAGTLRLSKRIALITDNWFFFQGTGFPFFFSYGMRVLFQNSTVELALINSSDARATIGFPYISYHVKLFSK